MPVRPQVRVERGKGEGTFFAMGIQCEHEKTAAESAYTYLCLCQDSEYATRPQLTALGSFTTTGLNGAIGRFV